MRVAFVGSNPSHLGPDSPAKQNLFRWVRSMDLKVGYSFYNVSDQVTEDNRPLKKSEFQLDKLELDLRGCGRIVALGNTAAEALDLLKIEYFKLPHPSPKNRTLNDKTKIKDLLVECKKYLEN